MESRGLKLLKASLMKQQNERLELWVEQQVDVVKHVNQEKVMKKETKINKKKKVLQDKVFFLNSAVLSIELTWNLLQLHLCLVVQYL